MTITAQDFITDYPNTAQQVVENYTQLSEQQRHEHESTDSIDYWYMQACQIGIGIIESTPAQFNHSGSILVKDIWEWILPSVREQMEQENHVLYQAWSLANEQTE